MDGFHHSESRFTGASGTDIYYQTWQPQSEPRAVIIVVHGAAEHGGRYEPFAAHFTASGYVVAAIDLEGHGKSGGGRCRLRSIDDYVRDAATLAQLIGAQFPDIPRVLLGHSMGGLVACLLLLEEQEHYLACVLSGAALATVQDPPAYQRLLIKFLSALAPGLGVLQLDASGVSRNPQVVEQYVSDPLNYTGKLPVRLLSEMFRAMQLVHSRAADIRLPILILHGGKDVMTAPAGSESLHAHVGSRDKQLHIYSDSYHEIFNEPERSEVFAEIESWLAERLVASDAAG